jgi:hypothetical protein
MNNFVDIRFLVSASEVTCSLPKQKRSVWEDVGGVTAWRGRLGYQFQKAGRNQWR